MSGKTRSPLQVSDKFLLRLKDLQRKIRMKTGNERSLRELTDDLALSPAFDEIEKKVMQNDIDIGFNIRFDRRLIKWWIRKKRITGLGFN